MPEEPEIEDLLPLLANIAKERADIISTKEFRKILVDIGFTPCSQTKFDYQNCFLAFHALLLGETLLLLKQTSWHTPFVWLVNE